VPAFGWDTYVLAEASGHENTEHQSTEHADTKHGNTECINTAESLITAENTLENEFLKAHFDLDGSVELTDKKTGHVYKDLGIFEDCGDIGNEYIFFAPVNDVPVTTKGTKAEITVAEDNACRAVIRVKHTMMLPDAADETLAGEIEDLVEFKHRKASRGSHLVPFEIVTEYTLEKYGKGLKVKTTFNNQIKDHRLRVLFEISITQILCLRWQSARTYRQTHGKIRAMPSISSVLSMCMRMHMDLLSPIKVLQSMRFCVTEKIRLR